MKLDKGFLKQLAGIGGVVLAGVVAVTEAIAKNKLEAEHEEMYSAYKQSKEDEES